MANYTIVDGNRIEIDFHGVKPDAATRSKMKAVKIWWDPSKMVWFEPKNDAPFRLQRNCAENL